MTTTFFSWSDTEMRQRLFDEARRVGLGLGPVDATPIEERDLAELPDPAQRYLRWAGVLGRPRDRSFCARLTGRFRTSPGGRWMRCTAWQYNTCAPVARLFHMRLDAAGFIPMFGWDTYLAGRGEMRGKLLGVIPVASGSGPEFDLGELVTYLNDAMMLAPSMLLCPATVWTAVDHDAFDVNFSDAGLTVEARVYVDDAGRLIDFSTTDRWCVLKSGLVRTPWNIPVSKWQTIGDRRVPEATGAIWRLPDGPFPYVEGGFDPRSIQFGVTPSAKTPSGPPLGGPTPERRVGAEALANEVLDAVLAVPIFITSPLYRSRHLRWGATDEEVAASMPGDELVFSSQFTATRAITIHARPEQVWPWLVQVGFGRAGFYSFDLLDNLGRPSAEEVLSQWQEVHVGDLVAPMKSPPTIDTSFIVDSLAINDFMVWSKPDASWAWSLTALDQDRTRLVTRLRQHYRVRPSTLLTMVLSEFGDFAMMRKMLRGIKERSEQPTKNPDAASTAG